MIVLTAYGEFTQDGAESGFKACEVVREHSLKEPGCERYDFFLSSDHPTRFVFVEEWTSQAHLDTHFQQSAFQEFFATIGPFLATPPEIRIFESTLTSS